MEVRIEKEWKSVLADEFEKPYFEQLVKSIKMERANHTIYPAGSKIFAAFDLCPWSQVKVVIVGQDPYHGPGEAMGLSFSVPRGKRVPPSLRNIFKEIKNDLGHEPPEHGDLTSWASQGVLLLNSILTVRHKEAGSHRKLGWIPFTDMVLSKLSQEKENLVFMLWGKFAQSKLDLIDQSKHFVLQSAHPSPLARNKFFHNAHFSKTNTFLRKHHLTPIQWKIEN